VLVHAAAAAGSAGPGETGGAAGGIGEAVRTRVDLVEDSLLPPSR
jgi:hypothetical protein